ncbi:MAG: hypothetical protein ACLPTJ_03635 [Solirubrobacteraceae bacterium]
MEITIELNGTPVSTSGQLQVAPESTTSYSISAQAMSYSKTLGTITVQVDLTACIAPSLWRACRCDQRFWINFCPVPPDH